MENFKKPKTLVDQIYSSLSRAISRGILKPGTILIEQELQKRFEVSRSPIREALRMLESDGLVTMDAYKRKYVRHLTRLDLSESVPVLSALEGLAAKIAVPKMTKRHIEELKLINSKMKQAFIDENHVLCTESNHHFHSIFIKVADNKALTRSVRSIVKSAVWLWMGTYYYQDRSNISLAIKDHDRIIEALESRDEQLAEIVVRSHIDSTIDRYLQQTASEDRNVQLNSVISG